MGGAAVGYSLQFVGRAEDEIRIDAEDALGAILARLEAEPAAARTGKSGSSPAPRGR